MSIKSVLSDDQGRIANPQPVAKIKAGRISQPITDAADATGTRPVLEFKAPQVTAHTDKYMLCVQWCH